MSRKRKLASLAKATGGYGLYPWGIDRLDLSAESRLLFLRLLNWRSDEVGVGYLKLGKIIGLGWRRARKAMRELEERGLVRNQARPDGTPRMRGRAHVRVVALDVLAKALGDDATEPAKEKDPDPGPPSPVPAGKIDSPDSCHLTDAVLATIPPEAMLAAYEELMSHLPEEMERVSTARDRGFHADRPSMEFFVRRHVPQDHIHKFLVLARAKSNGTKAIRKEIMP